MVLAIGSIGSGPQDAQALPPVPITGGLGGIAGVGVNLVTGGVGSAAVEGFGALLAKLFDSNDLCDHGPRRTRTSRAADHDRRPGGPRTGSAF